MYDNSKIKKTFEDNALKMNQKQLHAALKRSWDVVHSSTCLDRIDVALVKIEALQNRLNAISK